MELKEIVRRSLESTGHAGLVNDNGECGCYGEDLMCCLEPGIGCEAAYVFECHRCAKQDSCELRIEDSDFVCSTGKHFCTPVYQVCQNTDKTPDENGLEFASKNDASPANTSPFALGA